MKITIQDKLLEEVLSQLTTLGLEHEDRAAWDRSALGRLHSVLVQEKYRSKKPASSVRRKAVARFQK